MHGTGNDFIVIEDFNGDLKEKEKVIAETLCTRRFGIGADGILFIRASNIADVAMIIINADGSHAAMCGNGIRCFAKYLFDKKIVQNNIIKIETGDGIKKAELYIHKGEVEGITINMGRYSFNPKDIPAISEENIINKSILINNKMYRITSLLMGVPHTVIMCNIEEINVEEGRDLEKYRIFPKGTNVNFCQVIDKKTIKVKTWERGAGPTLACGTGSCAVAVVSNLLGYTDKDVKVNVPGGELKVKISEDTVFMSGPAVIVFEGEIML